MAIRVGPLRMPLACRVGTKGAREPRYWAKNPRIKNPNLIEVDYLALKGLHGLSIVEALTRLDVDQANCPVFAAAGPFFERQTRATL